MSNKNKLVPVPPKRFLRYIGILGFSVPIVLIIGTVYKGCEEVLHTISSYYHSVMGDFFVGALCAIALCMYAYKGYDNTDNVLSNLAGLCLLGVAWFPTSICNENLACIDYCDVDSIIGRMHYISATIFFLILAFFCIFQFVKGDEPFSKQKRKRNTVYYTCGALILISILSIAVRAFTNINFPLFDYSCYVFWAETVALWSFSTAWLIKGEVMLRDQE